MDSTEATDKDRQQVETGVLRPFGRANRVDVHASTPVLLYIGPDFVERVACKGEEAPRPPSSPSDVVLSKLAHGNPMKGIGACLLITARVCVAQTPEPIPFAVPIEVDLHDVPSIESHGSVRLCTAIPTPLACRGGQHHMC